jgi:pimeloyl-ACP methyl ester carboxylesterase
LISNLVQPLGCGWQAAIRVIAPDLRGFGDKPNGPFGAENDAADMLTLLDARDKADCELRHKLSRNPM